MLGIYKKTLEKIANPIKDNGVPAFLYWMLAPIIIIVLSTVVRFGLFIFAFLIFYVIGNVSEEVVEFVSISILIISLIMATWVVFDLWRVSRK
jgi:hypothetical protein